MSSPIFKNKQWVLTWAANRKHSIEIASRTQPILEFAMRYPHNGKIVYDYPEQIPEYIKEKVRIAFKKKYGV